MKRESKVKGSAQHVAAGIGSLILIPLIGPFAILAYPVLLACAKKGIAEEMDKIHLKNDIDVSKAWRCNRLPGETHIKVSSTQFTEGGLFLPLTLTREHTFIDDNDD